MAGAQSLLLNALAQSDVNMNFHKLLNLDTSNLSISGLPPDVIPPAHNFLNGWVRATQTWSFAQPGFGDLSGNLTSAQQTAITQLGTITAGVWQGTVLGAAYVPTLDLIRQPNANLSMNMFHIINLANGVNAQDAVTMSQLQSVASGLQVKAPVAAASNGVHTSLSGLTIPIDGYFPQNGDRILVKDQATGFHYQNGIYIAGTGAWTRSTDMTSAAQFPGAYVLVNHGTANSGTSWVQVTPATVDIVGPDTGAEPVFVLFSNATQSINAGPGLQLNGNVMSAVGSPNRIAIGTGIDIDPAYAGQGSINTLGTITKGVWAAGVIGAAYGGTGFNNPGTISLDGNFATLGIGLSTYSLTFQLGGNTLLTLPLSGTLATLAGVETFTNKSIDIGQLTGLLPLTKGGTGATTQVQAAKNILPSIVGVIAGTLKTDGTNIFWG